MEYVLINEASLISSCLLIRYVGVRKREDWRDGEATEAKGRKISYINLLFPQFFHKTNKQTKRFDLRSAFLFFVKFLGESRTSKFALEIF